MTMGYWLQALSVLTFSALLCAVRAGGQGQPALNLMPVPADLQMGSGSLRMDASFSVALTGQAEARLDRALQRF